MDIYCYRCGEPMEVDALHDIAHEFEITYSDAAKRFSELGCGVWDHSGEPCNAPMFSPKQSAVATASMIMSDHPDDWAADADFL